MAPNLARKMVQSMVLSMVLNLVLDLVALTLDMLDGGDDGLCADTGAGVRRWVAPLGDILMNGSSLGSLECEIFDALVALLSTVARLSS